MTNTEQVLVEKKDTIFRIFDEVYLFGSSLRTESPADIDLLLVYGEGRDLRDVKRDMQLSLGALCSTFEGTIFDLTVMSTSEVQETAILEQIQCKQIKGGINKCADPPKPAPTRPA